MTWTGVNEGADDVRVFDAAWVAGGLFPGPVKPTFGAIDPEVDSRAQPVSAHIEEYRKFNLSTRVQYPPRLDNPIEKPAIDQILRGPVAHDQHRLQGLASRHRLEKPQLSFHLRHDFHAHRPISVFALANRDDAIRPIENQVNLNAFLAGPGWNEVGADGEPYAGKPEDLRDDVGMLDAQVFKRPTDANTVMDQGFRGLPRYR